MFNDLKDIDEEYYNSLKGLKDMGADVEHIYIDFHNGRNSWREANCELVPNWANIDVTEENLPEYIEACLKYRMLGRYEAQLMASTWILHVIPEPLLTILFDFQELELLMCGMPEIDMEDGRVTQNILVSMITMDQITRCVSFTDIQSNITCTHQSIFCPFILLHPTLNLNEPWLE
jgi:hypothetical protein